MTDRPDPSAGDADATDGVVKRDFNTGFRGYDSGEVIAHLEQVAARLRATRDGERAWKARAQELEARLAAMRDAPAPPPPPAPVLDENAAIEALGVETANILRKAHEAASAGEARAEADAAGILQAAHEDAASGRLQAEGVLSTWPREAEARAARSVADAGTEAGHVRARAQAEAAELVEQGRVRGQEMIRDAQMTKESVLGDLLRRRKVAQVQIEQLRAGRERLLDAYRTVRRTLDEVTDELQRADSEARMAAEAVGRRAAMDAAAVSGSGSGSGPSTASPAAPPRRRRPPPH